MKKLLITVLAAGLFYGSANAQEIYAGDLAPSPGEEREQKEIDEFNEQKHHFVGANFGFATGRGFSYKYLHKKIGIQLTALPVFGDSYSNVYAGLQATRRIGQSNVFGDILNFNLYGGAGWEYSEETSNVVTGGVTSARTTSSDAFFSLGFGLEYIAFKRLSLNLNGGYGLAVDPSPNTQFAASVGMHYKIK